MIDGKKITPWLIGVAIATVALSVLNMPVKQRDIDACVKATNYSADRCVAEIGR